MNIPKDQLAEEIVNSVIKSLPKNWTATIEQWDLIKTRMKTNVVGLIASHEHQQQMQMNQESPAPEDERYKERYKDLLLHKVIVVVDDEGIPYQIELYGRNMMGHGNMAWVLGKRTPNTTIAVRSLDD